MSALYDCPFGHFHLQRIPDTDKNLQAWNTADSYMLKQLSEWLEQGKLDLTQANILIINDAFGALSTILAQYGCDSWGDSFVSHEAIRLNIQNNCPEHQDKVNYLKSTDALVKKYDLVLFKEVKNQTFFKEQMQRLRPHLNAETLILGGIMAKNLQKNTLQMLNSVLGSAQASLTWKKSRLLFVKFEQEADKALATQRSENFTKKYILEGSEEMIFNMSNVFSRTKLDIGTRFFLQHLPRDGQFKNIIDLGCGNGVLSLRAAQLYPEAQINCIDESYMAIASAKLTLKANAVNAEQRITYQAANALSNSIEKSADLILCNPPFHQQYVVGDAIAWQMFQQAKRVLKKGGELWIVGNRHLAYHIKLKKLFGNQSLIATNNKFVILKAIKS
ncbi:methyltransferase [sulfur-oxidizing endosymbiont of Gigantopelta aegis]|uniref:methyltransferase n=1 Tax=sulfur-oxidizing endosymbiont of Gigantopelta aegis TaxID=2794934 RepID=UPI0018DBD7F3|nr:methyltransferase [sulfur-oxidizing endosymbiont of Gigantopelta aegis]